MSALRRSATLALGVLAVAAATLLLMGNLRSVEVGEIQVEQARLQAQARLWENRLEQVRSEFRDRLLHSGLLDVLEHPDDWSSNRLVPKLDKLRQEWSQTAGFPMGFIVLRADGSLHSISGDSSGAAAGFAALRRADNATIAVLNYHPAGGPLLILQYYIPPAASDVRFGRMAALINIGPLLKSATNPPQSWSLLTGADRVVLSTNSTPQPPEINESTWPLLVGEGSGTLDLSGGNTLCFARVQIPGMKPLLLVEPVPVRNAGARTAALGLLALGMALLIWNRRAADGKPLPAEENAQPVAGDPAEFRQIFQTIDDPLCVIDPAGVILRANRRAHERLCLRRGKPDPELSIQHDGIALPAADFLAQAAAAPASVEGACQLQFGDAVDNRLLRIYRLYRDVDGNGPLLLHFLPVTGIPTPDEDPERLATHAPLSAPQSPYPAIAVSANGIIMDCNAAARRAAPRLAPGQLISDALPTFDTRDLPRFLNSPTDFTIESLLGAAPHEFTAIRCGDGFILYGHPLADSRKLEIALGQAQENFFTLCALTPVPLLLVDPCDQLVTDANGAAADLFGTTTTGLRGMPLALLAEDPWDPTNDTLMIARTAADGRQRCGIRYELIKIEGAPLLLVILDPLTERVAADAPLAKEYWDGNSEATPATPAAPEPDALPPLPLGPALLITWDPTVREVARRLFEKSGHLCESFTSLDDTTVWLISHAVRPEFVAIDLTDFDDCEAWISDLRERCGDVPCIGFTDGEAYELPDGGLNALLPKPFDLQAISDTLTVVRVEAGLLLVDK